MNPLQYTFYFWIFIRGISYGSECQVYFVVFFDIFKNNVVEIVHKMSTLHIHFVALTVFSNSHYGYSKTFCMVDYIIPYA